jgi:hypothetical protein
MGLSEQSCAGSKPTMPSGNQNRGSADGIATGYGLDGRAGVGT